MQTSLWGQTLDMLHLYSPPDCWLQHTGIHAKLGQTGVGRTWRPLDAVREKRFIPFVFKYVAWVLIWPEALPEFFPNLHPPFKLPSFYHRLFYISALALSSHLQVPWLCYALKEAVGPRKVLLLGSGSKKIQSQLKATKSPCPECDVQLSSEVLTLAHWRSSHTFLFGLEFLFVRHSTIRVRHIPCQDDWGTDTGYRKCCTFSFPLLFNSLEMVWSWRGAEWPPPWFGSSHCIFQKSNCCPVTLPHERIDQFFTDYPQLQFGLSELPNPD